MGAERTKWAYRGGYEIFMKVCDLNIFLSNLQEYEEAIPKKQVLRQLQIHEFKDNGQAQI